MAAIGPVPPEGLGTVKQIGGDARWRSVEKTANGQAKISLSLSKETKRGRTIVLVIDLETTGLDPAVDRITEVSVREVASGSVRFHALVNPQRDIPEVVQDLTGLTTAVLAHETTFDMVAGDLADAIRSETLIGHHVEFDLGFLRYEFQRAGVRPPVSSRWGICTKKLGKFAWPDLGQWNLKVIATHLDLNTDDHHRANADTEMTRSVYLSARERTNVFDLARSLSKQATR